MDNVPTTRRRHKWLRVIGWVFAIIISLPVFIVLLFQLGSVQNFTKTKIESFLRNKFHTSVIIGQLRLTWWNSLSLKKVYLGDTRKNALLSSGSLNVTFNLLDLINNKLVIKKLDWDDILINVYRLPGDTTYNYQFIMDAFATGEKDTAKATGSPMTYSIGDVSITNCRLRFMDAPAGLETNVTWKSLVIDPEKIKPENSLYDIDKLKIDGLRGIIGRKYVTVPLVAQKAKEEIEGADTSATPLLLKARELVLTDCNIWYDDEGSGMNTNWQIGDFNISKAVFDPAKETILADDVKIHKTGGSFTTQKGKDTITTVIAADTAAQTAWIFKVKNIDFDNIGFNYNKLDVKPVATGIDFNHLKMNGIRVQAKDLAYNTDSILVDLNELTLQDKSGFAIRQGHGEILYSDKVIALRNLLLQTNRSRIASEVVAKAPSFKTVSENLAKLQVNAILENTYIDMNEISQLMPDLKKNPSLRPVLRKFITADGKVSGSMASLNINSLHVTDRDGTTIFVTGIIQNASDPDKLIAILQQIDIRSGEKSIKSWVPPGTVPDSISIPAWLHLQGSARYSKTDLLTNLRLTSSMGDVTVNGNASRYMDAANSRYDVRVPLLRMDVGKLLQDTSLGRIDATLSAKGTGYDYKTLTTNINLLIKEAYYNKYVYHDISSVASLNKGNYQLFLESKDTNALATVQLAGLLDSLKSSVAGTLELKKIDLYATRLSATPMAAKGNMVLDVKSFLPRHLNGSVVLSGIQFADDSTIYAMDTLNLLASDTASQQQLNLSGPFGFLSANGDYDYTKAFTDLSAMIQQHLQPADSSKPFVAREREVMDLNASLVWPASMQKFAQGLVMEQPLTINGKLNTDSSHLSVGFLLPHARYNEFTIDTLKGLINSDSSKMVSDIYLSKLIHPQFPLEKTTVDLVAQKGVLETNINMLDREARRKYALGAIISFLPSNMMSFALKPELILNKTPWTVSDSNKIMMSAGTLRSADLAISSGGQSIAVKTVAQKDNATPDLEVNINKFRLSTITALLEKDSLLAEGVATGKATISNYDKSPLINAKLQVDSITVMKTAVGSLSLDASTPEPDKYNLKAQLSGNGNDVAVDGSYAKDLDFNINLNRLNMSSIEPFTMGSANRMSGTTSGKLTLKGTTDNPQVRGTLGFDSVAANITAIGTYLRLNKEQLVFDDKGIKFNGFAIADSLNNKAVVDGSILTKDYKDYRFQLAVKATNFMAAGPKQSPDQLVYGPAFIDADAKIRGSLKSPRVDLNLLLKDSSKLTLVVPEDDPGIADREGVIVFVDKNNQLDSSLLRIKDSTHTGSKAGMGGMSLTAQLEVTPNSTVRVIIDQQNGDYLEIKGKANIDASMTPSSNLSLTGRYEINEGSYNMSLNNLIKRKFSIEKGSTITLQGDVTKALVDITARYRVEAVGGDLVEDQLTGASDTKKTQFRQKVPVDVYLLIKNELLKPDISFRLDMPERERNALNGVVYNRIKQINEIESELNKQVMGLLVLNSFIPDNPLALVSDRGGSGVEGTARKSASKLISQQLNNFAGSLIKGFDVNFDLESQDDYTTGKAQNSTNLNVGVSKSLFKDRVSVSVGSSVNLEGPQQTQQASTLIGDVSVDYKITPDGRYRIRGYRQNETDAIVEGQIIETGASFIYVIDYDEFRELFHSKKKTTKETKKGK